MINIDTKKLKAKSGFKKGVLIQIKDEFGYSRCLTQYTYSVDDLYQLLIKMLDK